MPDRPCEQDAERPEQPVTVKRAALWARPWSAQQIGDWKWGDAAPALAAQDDFAPSKKAEDLYRRQLVSVSREIGRIVKSGQTPEAIEDSLRRYGRALEPWARQAAVNMVSAVNRKNLRVWSSAAKRAGQDMRRLIEGPGIGAAVRDAIDNNVKLIQSLAFDEAEKVAELVKDSLSSGARADEIAAKIAGLSNASSARARTIARTEVSKAATALTQARAGLVGSPGYIWRTTRDGDTRPSHRAMEGVFVPWDKPPTLDGMTGHAGEFPNCRCYPEPVIPNEETGGVHRPALPTRAQERNSGQRRLLSVWERQPGSAVVAPTPDGRLLNADRPIIDVQNKLAGYSLNPDHPRGGHKAKVFRAALDLGPEDAEAVAAQIKAWLPHVEGVTMGEASEYGVPFTAKVPITGNNGRVVDVTARWMYKRDEGADNVISVRPFLTTFYVDKRDAAV